MKAQDNPYRAKFLAHVVRLMAIRYGLDELDTDACIRIAAVHLQSGQTASSAYDQARQLALKIKRDAQKTQIISMMSRIKAAMPALQVG